MPESAGLADMITCRHQTEAARDFRQKIEDPDFASKSDQSDKLYKFAELTNVFGHPVRSFGMYGWRQAAGPNSQIEGAVSDLRPLVEDHIGRKLIYHSRFKRFFAPVEDPSSGKTAAVVMLFEEESDLSVVMCAIVPPA